MRIICSYGFLLFFLIGCKKDDEFMERPDERLLATLSGYQKQLSGAQYGWLGYLFSQGGEGATTLLFQFDNQGRVTTLADINSNTAQIKDSGSYRLKAAQLPSLQFDSYSYLHLLSDPDPKVIGGDLGVGLMSDFEFSILSASPDTIKLRGHLNNRELLLVRAQKHEKEIFEAAPLALKNLWNDVEHFAHYYNRLTVGNKKYDFIINTINGTIHFFYNDGGFKHFSTKCVYTPTGIMLSQPFIDRGTRITEFHHVQIDKKQSKISLMMGKISYQTENEETPLVVDPEAATNMQYGTRVYTSETGFTINGETDAFRIRKVPSFFLMAYYPSYQSSGVSSLQLFCKSDSLHNYGSHFSAQIQSSGVIIFQGKNVKFKGDASSGALVKTPLMNSTTQLLDPEGYYVFQIASDMYDLVSRTNSKIWIRLSVL